MNGTGFSYQEVQKSLIQSLFTEQIMIPKISSFINVDDFNDENCKAVYTALITLTDVTTENKKSITITDIYNWSIENNQPINVEYLIQLNTPSNESPSLLAEVLKRLSVQNKAQIAINQTIERLNFDSPNTLEILSEAESQLSDLASSLIHKDDDKTLKEELEEFKEFIKQDKEIEVDTVPLFNPQMNMVLNNGWQQEKLIVIGARTGIGKSVFAIDSTVAACNANRSVLFFSLEMSKTELYQRLLAVQSDVIIKHLNPGADRVKEEVERIDQAISEMQEWKLEIDDTPGITVENIVAKSKLKAMSQEGLDMVIIDYLQLITPNSSIKNRQEQVAEISRQMKLLAKTLKVPVMVLVQLKRNNSKDDSGKDELPTKDEIRESGAIAQDADVVLLIHRNTRKEDETDSVGLFISDKNRGGPAPRTFKVRAVLEKSAFRDIPKEELENEESIKAEINLEELDQKFTNDESSNNFGFLDNISFEENNIDLVKNNYPEFNEGPTITDSDDSWTKDLFE